MIVKLLHVCDSGYDGQSRRWMFADDPAAQATPSITLDDGSTWCRGSRVITDEISVSAPDGSYLAESVDGELLLYVPGYDFGFGPDEVHSGQHRIVPALSR